MGSENVTEGFDDTPDQTSDIVGEMRAAVLSGEPWFRALLAAIARWRVPEEMVGGRHYRYLIGGEAFDWLLLAERILDELADVIPAAEKDALLYHARAPEEITPDDFRRAIGPAKYRAHLNYLYGVTVEEALQLTYEEDLEKERRAHVWAGEGFDRTVYQRIYGNSREHLLTEFRTERRLGVSDRISLDDLKEFTYWLFKYRLRWCAPPRVASDTTRGLERLARLEALRRPAASTIMPMHDVLDLRASLV
ncbi:MAG: hypothetical protein AB7R89_21670 [Dehalococcoidia bacterium]